MTPILRLLSVLALAFGLSSCDSLKSKALAVIDKKIEETAPDGASEGDVDGAEPGAGGAASGAANASKEARVRSLTDASYDSFTKTQNHVVLVDFYADWCPPCRKLAPILDKVVAANNGKVILGKYDVDKHNKVAQSQGVSGIPDVRIFVNGKQVDRFVGLIPEEVIRQKISAQLAKVSSASPKPEPKPQPKPEPKPEPKPGTEAKPEPKPDPNKPEEPKEVPKIKPMDKDWLPPGIQRKNT